MFAFLKQVIQHYLPAYQIGVFAILYAIGCIHGQVERFFGTRHLPEGFSFVPQIHLIFPVNHKFGLNCNSSGFIVIPVRAGFQPWVFTFFLCDF